MWWLRGSDVPPKPAFWFGLPAMLIPLADWLFRDAYGLPQVQGTWIGLSLVAGLCLIRYKRSNFALFVVLAALSLAIGTFVIVAASPHTPGDGQAKAALIGAALVHLGVAGTALWLWRRRIPAHRRS